MYIYIVQMHCSARARYSGADGQADEANDPEEELVYSLQLKGPTGKQLGIIEHFVLGILLAFNVMGFTAVVYMHMALTRARRFFPSSLNLLLEMCLTKK